MRVRGIIKFPFVQATNSHQLSGGIFCIIYVVQIKDKADNTEKLQKHGVPSYSTIRRVVMGVDFDKLVAIFNHWAYQYVDLEPSDWCGIDGKSIKGTVIDHEKAYQNFVSIVSVFASKRGLVLGMEKFEKKQESEIVILQNLITALDLKDAVFSFDSLHCQKKLASFL
ncbi:ISAs1 family transposase [Nostoc sp. DedQUE03]|uniref:ISAs1 family transposase n=1 Tax=Nostoc sp. DedQUE03 TaxID=3075389 RepID=UPI00391D8725